MTAIRRNIESVSGDQGGKRSRSIAYRSSIPPRNLSHPLGVDDLPLIGSTTHPEDPVLVARDYSATTEGTGSLVTVTFSTPSYGGGTAIYDIPRTDGSNFYYGAGIEIVDVKIPSAFREIIEISNGDTSFSIKPWVTADSSSISESRLTLNASWGFYQPDIGDFRTLNAQNNKIHEWGGSRYLFRVEAIRAKDNDFYEFSVSWTEDNGTADPNLSPITDFAFPGSGMPYEAGHDPTDLWPNPPAGQLIRSPFHRLGVKPSDNPNTDPPKLLQIPMYSENLLGWQSLGSVGLPPGLIS